MDLAFALRAFVRTLDRGSMTAAARDLGLSQPAVSKLVRNLEAHTGARLIERSSRAMRPTAQGRVLYEASGPALGAIDAAIETVRGQGGTIVGELRVHGPVCLGESRLNRIVMDFQTVNPGVTVTLKLENRPPDLIRENFDLVLRIGRPEERDLVQRRIGLVRRILVAAPAYLSRRTPVTAPDDLLDHALLATDTVLGREGALSLCGAGGARLLPVRPMLTTNNTQVLLDAARAGHGIATVQLQLVVEDLASGRLVRVLPDHEIAATELFLVYPSVRFLRPAVRAFVDFSVPALQQIEGIES